jgi:hypothetical protein
MKQQARADRLTPALPNKGTCRSRCADATPAPYRHRKCSFRPARAEVCLAQPHHPTGCEEKEARESQAIKKSRPERRSINMKTKINEEMQLAIGNYNGPITKCRPGRARAPAMAASTAKKNASVEWYAKPIKDQKAMRKQMRILRAQQSRIAERNAAIKRWIGER